MLLLLLPLLLPLSAATFCCHFLLLLQALLELKGRLLVEAALEEVVSLVAAHLDVLQVHVTSTLV
jgi:hypothetical protein